MKGPFTFKLAGAGVSVGMSGVRLGLGMGDCSSTVPVGVLLATDVPGTENKLHDNNKSNDRGRTMIFR